MSYRGLSLWHETTPTDWTPRPALAGDTEADVAIVGAGYTGLWTAYYLARAEPSLRIVMVESEVAGFGASGRNGGWCSALFPTSLGETQDAAMRASVDEELAVVLAPCCQKYV
ncbi:MAG TPA: FAD-binding oxidoreductase, partial [Nocardioides sp.]|nr:FAD-binding oxidoreductase [Nocardioides sp.]